MPLTPAEVHNVAFKKPPIGKRGYDEEEVDSFLDIVEGELARLIEENNDLKSRLTSGEPLPQGLAGGVDRAQLTAVQEENARLQTRVGELEQALEAQRAVHEASEHARSGAAGVAPTDHHQQAVQMLALAQQTADQHISQAKAEADRLLSDARAAAERTVNEANEHHSRTIAEAEAHAKQLHDETATRASQTIQDAEQRVAAATANLEQRKLALERRVEELRTFEHEYRTRLKSYLESQLRDLDAGGPAEPFSPNSDRAEARRA
jgi:DivIVA domain-containing protein